MDEMQKHREVMKKIMELNERKKAIAYAIDQKIGELAGVSAQIGELSSELKTLPICKN